MVDYHVTSKSKEESDRDDHKNECQNQETSSFYSIKKEDIIKRVRRD